MLTIAGNEQGESGSKRLAQRINDVSEDEVETQLPMPPDDEINMTNYTSKSILMRVSPAMNEEWNIADEDDRSTSGFPSTA